MRYIRVIAYGSPHEQEVGLGESQGHGPQVNVQTEAFGTGDPK